MRNATLALLFTGAMALTGMTPLAPAVAAETQQQKDSQQKESQWRYVFHKGVWWYWLPTNRWVYWQDSQWKDYAPPVAANASSGAVVPGYAGTMQGSDAGSGSDIRPFYGRALSNGYYGGWGGSEIRPFYGRALMGRFGGGSWSGYDEVRPFYGHAGSSYGY